MSGTTSMNGYGGRGSQRGVGTLAIAMLLLFGTSITVLYMNRSLIFEQKTSANQVRATTALEVAEAGIEWTTGMLNSPTKITTACATSSSTSDKQFRDKYVTTASSTAVSPAPTTTLPGCQISGTTLTCGCPDTGTANISNSTSLPSFTVSFASVTGDSQAVRVTSTGCTSQTGACTSTTSTNADATATVSVILKIHPILPHYPNAPLSCGTTANISGSYNIQNNDVSTNGILVNCGSSITYGNGVTLDTIPGSPQDNALVGNDSSLYQLASNDTTCSNSSIFKAYFGTTVSEYAASPTTKTLSCSNASDCNNQITTAYNQGWRAFYLSSDFQLSGNGTLGSADRPVTIVSNNSITINGGWTVYGLVFSNSYNYQNLGTGNMDLYGALITCGAYNSNGNGHLNYDRSVLSNLQSDSGVMVRVPGSWRDWN